MDILVSCAYFGDEGKVFSVQQIPAVGDKLFIGFSPAPEVKKVVHIPGELSDEFPHRVNALVTLD